MVSSEHQTSASFLPSLVASEKVSLSSVGSVFFRAELIQKSDLRIILSGSVYAALHTEECEFSAVWLWTGRDIDWLSLHKQCIFFSPEHIFTKSPSQASQDKQLWFEKIGDNPDGFFEDKSTWSFKIKVFQ